MSIMKPISLPGEAVPELWYCACSLTDLMVTPVLVLKMSAVKPTDTREYLNVVINIDTDGREGVSFHSL